MGRFPFRSALVTGASSGIGEAFTRLLAGAGIPTVVVARRAERLLALQAELPGIEVLVADLTTEVGLRAVLDTSGSFVDLEPSRLSREVALNVDAVVRISHAALGPMTERGRGWLLNVSSVAGFQAAPGLAVYGATKSFVTTFSEAIHEEVRPRGVVVTAVCPGLTRTEFQLVSSSGARSARFPAFAWMTAEAVAGRALRDGARGRALSIPGTLNRALVMVSPGLPRSVVRRSSGRIGRSARSRSHN